MKINIKNLESVTHINLPCEEKEIIKFCEKAKIINNANTEVEVKDIESNESLSKILENEKYNLDKLNYLMKRLDSFSKKELNAFYAVVYGENTKEIDTLINLTFNTHCVGVVNDFNNIEKIGKELYLTEKGGVSLDEIDKIDGKQYFEKLIKENKNAIITPYGVVYKNENEYEQIFDGKHFPDYLWKENLGTVEINSKGYMEYLYLPIEQNEITKALQRLEVEDISQCEVKIYDEFLSKNMLNCILENEQVAEKIMDVSNFIDKYKEVLTREREHIDKLMVFLNPKNLKDINAIMENCYEFEIYPKIYSAKEYGKYMICDSGYFEYDENLEEYIDFKSYGEEKIKHENGIFTEQGYIMYHGYDINLSDILSEIGLEIKESNPEILKLYMPLKGSTYYDENSYGEYYETDYSMDIYADELAYYEKDITKAIKENIIFEKERGLMKYYDEIDTVNAKVKKYEFSVENIDGKLMGVATLELNNKLNEVELSKIKDIIEGQASDGWGESFKQIEIKIDGSKGVYISFWGTDNWNLKTAEELGITEQKQSLKMDLSM